jgi:hypothetical protein
MREAAEKAASFRLRAYDAVHLVSALTIATRVETQVVFACWDAGLSEAARQAGLQLLGPYGPIVSSLESVFQRFRLMTQSEDVGHELEFPPVLRTDP